jgi:lysophospholipid acyltransferase (LPLAT)-like uncharacterized protein
MDTNRNPFAVTAAAMTGTVIAAILFFWALTWRKDTRDLEKLDRRLKDGERLVAIFWHGKYFPLFALAKGRRATVLTTRSFRGEVIAFICRWFGYRPVRIDHGAGKQGLASIELGTAGAYPLLAIAVDGPTGPARQPKAGAIRIAADFGYRLLPISVNGDPKTVLKNRWDRHEVPLPFARVRIAVGDPVDIPRDIVPEDLPEWQARLRERIEAADPASLKFS